MKFKPAKTAKVIRGLQELRKAHKILETPGFHHVAMMHDDGCPSLETQCAADCQCRPDYKYLSTEGNN